MEAIAASPPNCMTLGKFWKLPVPQLPHLQIEHPTPSCKGDCKGDGAKGRVRRDGRGLSLVPRPWYYSFSTTVFQGSLLGWAWCFLLEKIP